MSVVRVGRMKKATTRRPYPDQPGGAFFMRPSAWTIAWFDSSVPSGVSGGLWAAVQRYLHVRRSETFSVRCTWRTAMRLPCRSRVVHMWVLSLNG